MRVRQDLSDELAGLHCAKVDKYIKEKKKMGCELDGKMATYIISYGGLCLQVFGKSKAMDWLRDLI